MTIACPACHSENTQKYSIIYRQGTTNVDLSTVEGIGGYSGANAAAAKTTGTAQSQLAGQCAPPPKMPYLVPTIVILIVSLILGKLVSVSLGKLMGDLLAGLGIVGLIAYLVFATKHNFRIHPVSMQEWNQKFLCLRCETTFLVSTTPHALPSLSPSQQRESLDMAATRSDEI